MQKQPDLCVHTYSASQRRGLLCSEYPLDSKERTDSQLNSPSRLRDEDKSVTKKEGEDNFFRKKVAFYFLAVRSGEVLSTGAQHDR